MADLSTNKKAAKGRTGAPVRPGHAMRRVRLACGHLQRDRIAHTGDHVWCEAGCSNWLRVVTVEE
ncbi:hypothetical protein [Kribbella deserti]|uniref:Uncharacterized protein n=1 Tax=Kribbella deserti TaxID=1926257 RepID=A0ABV6QR31_9ACTN